MNTIRILKLVGCILMGTQLVLAQVAGNAPLPDIHQLLNEAQEHQKQLDAVRENYTYTSLQTTEEIDSKGQVSKTESAEYEKFFVNGHEIARQIKKDGKPLDEHAQQKETERVTKLAEKAQSMPRDKSLEGQSITVRRILEIADVSNPRREQYRGRSTIAFDFVGRKDAKTHGILEEIAKKLQGSIWIDEADRQVAHLDVRFDDNFHLAGGLVANVQKGSNMHFDQAPVNGELWLPTGGEVNLQVRLLLVKGIRQHLVERDTDYKRFRVETQQNKDAKVTKKP